ncbi:MAG TPA: bifunctional 5,10-methylenetetrahydrofolate dehydrogenase/5,10-methenyltetrahydrofolate cyclohydrolase [Candidatus Saccharimonadales bacterium]|nr:bifunctional 5,10-methylenetetrahydrofolate dehydrogenase/5,10-methenyltetrahydrofolate cyclohydrolase [Candidatus Saccharimonadales bacterium]
MKILDGLELAGYIKERQARQVRALRQSQQIFPKLAIVRTIDDARIAAYVRLKKAYGNDILIDVEEHFVRQGEALELIKKLNAANDVTAIIIQLPLADPAQTEELLNAVDPKKDVDGLGKNAILQPATALSIMWLLDGYNIELRGRKIVIVGRGRLVGAPLEKMLKELNLDVTVVTKETSGNEQVIRDADILISAAGAPGLVKSDMIKIDAVVVDAGVATDKGKLVGDIDPAARERHDLTITPEKGGVGPLTVCALFDNVIRAASLN